MKHLSTAWLTTLLLLGGFSVWAQGLSRFDHRIVPPSPESAQLGVFGSVPPDLNTGAVQTTIPLLDVKSRQLSLALALNYHFTGLQVNEVAPWVGLGWTLSAGGVITRTIQGLPDESDHGYLDPQTWPFLAPLRSILPPAADLAFAPYANAGPQASADYALRNAAEKVAQGQWDSEPDTYNISTPIYSGKLYIDHTGNITCSPRADVRISGTPGSSWTITTGDGTQYVYSKVEYTQSDALNTAALVPTAWYLSTVMSADGTDQMDFEYAFITSPNPVPAATIVRQSFSEYAANYTACNSANSTWKSLPDILLGSAPSENIYSKTPYLKAIRTATMEVLFRSDSLRTDIAPVLDRPARRLTRITSRDLLTDQVKKQYDLTYSYFGPSPNAKERRLRLDAVQEVGKPSYVFTYNSSQPMPSRDSFARDHWGYYNGRSNSTLMPSFPPTLAAAYNHYAGANRTPNGQAAMLGALQRVQYPTGGATQFDYEPNSAPVDCNDLDNQFGGASLGTGGTLLVKATAFGGAVFNGEMEPFEKDYARAHSAISGSIDGNSPAVRVPQNVDAALIDAPNGFTLLNLAYRGKITKPSSNSSSFGCSVPIPNIGAYLYQVDTTASFPGYVALVTHPICKVDYLAGGQPNTFPPVCQPLA